MLDLKKLRPVNGQVIVLDYPKEEKLGSIYLPETSSDRRLIKGYVLAEADFLLEDGTYVKTGLKPGDNVVYSSHAGAGNIHEQEKQFYRIIRWNEVLAIETR